MVWKMSWKDISWDIAQDVMINPAIDPEYDTTHYHHCPGCYCKYECTMMCTIEPDLEEDGKKFGSHSECAFCEARINEEEKYKSKEFWDRYNGFIK
jgi:hypothetical protein